MPVHSKPVVNESDERGLRLHLLLKKCTEVLREILFKNLSVNEETIQKYLILQRIFLVNNKLFRDQWRVLFPADPSTFDVYKFDLTLICVLLRAFCIFPNKLDWNSLPSKSDKSELANIIRLKFSRDLISHKKLETIENDFTKIWSDITDSLVALGCANNELDAMKNGPIDTSTYHTLKQTQKLLEETEEQLCHLKKAQEGTWWKVDSNVATFIGRELELEDIHNKINNQSTGIIGVVFYGLGGVGKTEMAIRYCHKYSNEYDNAIWINGDSTRTIESSFVELAKYLEISEKGSIDTVLKKVYDFFSARRTLYVFDNIDTFELVVTYFPQLSPAARKPTILITSQNDNWGNNLITHNVNVFSEESAVNLIKSQLCTVGIDCTLAHDLAKKMQYLPLALQQCISYIRKHRTAIKDYILYFDRNFTKIFETPLTGTGINYHKTILTVWKIALQKLEDTNESIAIDIIKISSLLDEKNISKELFLLLCDTDEVKLHTAMDTISSYSLMKVNYVANNECFYGIHTLVQKVIQLSLPETKIYHHKTTKLLMNAQNVEAELKRHFSYGNIWLNHVLSFADHAFKDTSLLVKGATLIENALMALENRSMYDTLLQFMEMVLKNMKAEEENNAFAFERIKRFLEPHHLFVYVRKKDSVHAFEKFISYNPALSPFITPEIKSFVSADCFGGNLDIFVEFVDGLSHLDTTELHGDMAVKYKLYQFLLLLHATKTLVCDRQEFLEHMKNIEPSALDELAIAHTKCFLAYCNNGAGKSSESLTLFEEAHDLYLMKLGEKDKYTLETKQWMAISLKEQNELRKALDLFTEVHQVRMDTLGENHYNTFESKNQIARTYHSLNILDEALVWFTDLYNIQINCLGENHENSLRTMTWIARTVMGQKKLDEALSLFGQLYEKQKITLGEEHEETLESISMTALIMKNQEKLDESLKLFEELYEKRKVKLGENHIDTFATMHSMALILHQQDRSVEAFQLYEDIYDKNKVTLGEDHEHTLNAMFLLAHEMKEQQKLDKAFEIFGDLYEKQKLKIG